MRELQPHDGILLIEQADIGARLLVTRDFEPVYVEGRLLLYVDYDTVNGAVRRHAYLLPEMSYVGDGYTRFWSIADVIGRLALMYERSTLAVSTSFHPEHGL